MGTVQFSPTDSTPRMGRTSGIPALSALSFYMRVLMPTSGDIACVLAIEDVGGSGSGRLIYTTSGNDLQTDDVVIRASSINAWIDLVMIPNGANWEFYVKLASSGSWTGPITQTRDTWTPDNINISGSIVAGEADIDFPLRVAKIVFWSAAKSAAAAQSEATVRDLVETSNAWFYNRCNAAATVGTDGSGAGNNFTVTGTPTDNSDDPWPADVRATASNSFFSFGGL